MWHCQYLTALAWKNSDAIISQGPKLKCLQIDRQRVAPIGRLHWEQIQRPCILTWYVGKPYVESMQPILPWSSWAEAWSLSIQEGPEREALLPTTGGMLPTTGITAICPICLGSLPVFNYLFQCNYQQTAFIFKSVSLRVINCTVAQLIRKWEKNNLWKNTCMKTVARLGMEYLKLKHSLT